MSKLLGEGVESRYFKSRLDLVDSLAVLGLSNPESVPGKGAVAVLLCSPLDI